MVVQILRRQYTDRIFFVLVDSSCSNIFALFLHPYNTEDVLFPFLWLLPVNILYPLYIHLLVFRRLPLVCILSPDWLCVLPGTFLCVHNSVPPDAVLLSLDIVTVVETTLRRFDMFLGRLLLVAFRILVFLTVLLDSVLHLILVRSEDHCILYLRMLLVKTLAHGRVSLLFLVYSLTLVYISSVDHAVGVGLGGTCLEGTPRYSERRLSNISMHIAFRQHKTKRG